LAAAEQGLEHFLKVRVDAFEGPLSGGATFRVELLDGFSRYHGVESSRSCRLRVQEKLYSALRLVILFKRLLRIQWALRFDTRDALTDSAAQDSSTRELARRLPPRLLRGGDLNADTLNPCGWFRRDYSLQPTACALIQLDVERCSCMLRVDAQGLSAVSSAANASRPPA